MRNRITAAVVAVGATLLAVCGAYALRQEPDRTGTTAADAAADPGDLAAEVAALRREVAELRALVQQSNPAAANPIAALRDVAIPDSLELCGQKLPLDRPDVREALAYELVLTVGKPTMPLLWMRRAPTMLPIIEARLRERGLPDDLKYLAMIESDLRWIPESPAGAVGLWQFMGATGKRYGLRVDRYMDERMDPDRATDAALSYLGTLHRQFGDWFLALAAYNAGETLLNRAMSDQGARAYFDLYLPYETRRYVLRIAAAKLVYEHPENYGLFRMQPIWSPTYRDLDVHVESRGGADLRALAKSRGVSYPALRQHNPQVKGPSLPQGHFKLRVPETPQNVDAKGTTKGS